MTAHAAPAVDVDQQVEQSHDQLASYEARLDPEALLLCSLMWVDDAPVGDIATVLDYLDPADFRRPVHGQIFTLMRDQQKEGGLITPAALAGKIASDATHLPANVYNPLLIALSGLGALPSQAVHYADQVLGESYRRNFSSMATYLTQVAREAPESELFTLMVEQGTAQREAWKRRRGLLATIHHTASTED